MSVSKLVRLWRSRLEDAQLRLDFARNYLNEIQQDFPAGDSPALADAIRAESIAQTEYLRVLRIFSEFVLDGNGKISDERERRKAASGE